MYHNIFVFYYYVKYKNNSIQIKHLRFAIEAQPLQSLGQDLCH